MNFDHEHLPQPEAQRLPCQRLLLRRCDCLTYQIRDVERVRLFEQPALDLIDRCDHVGFD